MTSRSLNRLISVARSRFARAMPTGAREPPSDSHANVAMFAQPKCAASAFAAPSRPPITAHCKISPGALPAVCAVVPPPTRRRIDPNDSALAHMDGGRLANRPNQRSTGRNDDPSRPHPTQDWVDTSSPPPVQASLSATNSGPGPVGMNISGEGTIGVGDLMPSSTVPDGVGDLRPRTGRVPPPIRRAHRLRSANPNRG